MRWKGRCRRWRRGKRKWRVSGGKAKWEEKCISEGLTKEELNEWRRGERGERP